MIEFKKIKITDKDSYEELRYCIEDTHIDDAVINSLKNYIGEKSDVILVEYPYYEKDFLSNFYRFYSKQHKVHSKLCYRIHFFSKLKGSGRDYYGYITLREGVEEFRIGATYLSPRLLISDEKNSFIITARFKAVVYGKELTLDAFPWMNQETDISVCAHVSVWSILRYYGKKNYGYKDALMGDVVESVKQEADRKIPSRGLSVNQISDIFSQYSFSPMLRGDEHHKLSFFKNEMLAYIESGIPLVAAINAKRHAVAVVGYRTVDIQSLTDQDLERYKEPNDNLAFYSSLATGVYVIDDNYFPYRMVDRELPISGEEIDYSMNEISHIVIPYCEKVLLDYNQIYERFIESYRQKVMDFGKEILICKVYIIASNVLKIQASNTPDMNPSLMEAILRVDMPRFVWCIDLGTLDEMRVGKISHRLIADSTASTNSKDIWLLYHNRASFSYRLDGDGADTINLEIEPYKLSGEEPIKSLGSVQLKNTNIWESIL